MWVQVLSMPDSSPGYVGSSPKKGFGWVWVPVWGKQFQNLPKKISKDKEATMIWQGVAIAIKSNPIPARWATHKLKIFIPQKFSHRSEHSKPHIRLPSLGVQQWKGHPEHLVQKVWSQEFHSTVGNRNSTVRGCIQGLVHFRTRGWGEGWGGSSDLIRDCTRLNCWYYRVSCRCGGWCGSMHGQRH